MNMHIADQRADCAAANHLQKICVDDYLKSVDGDLGRAAAMYIGIDSLIHGTSAPDVVMDCCVVISSSWLAATAAAPCQTEADFNGKLHALLHYLATDDDIELPDSIETIVGQLHAYMEKAA